MFRRGRSDWPDTFALPSHGCDWRGWDGRDYRATDTTLGRSFALKVLPAAMAFDPGTLARFQREARALAALNHPHIVTIFSVEQAEGVHFLTMELLGGSHSTS